MSQETRKKGRLCIVSKKTEAEPNTIAIYYAKYIANETILIVEKHLENKNRIYLLWELLMSLGIYMLGCNNHHLHFLKKIMRKKRKKWNNNQNNIQMKYKLLSTKSRKELKRKNKVNSSEKRLCSKRKKKIIWL